MSAALPDPSASRAVVIGFPRYKSGDFEARPAISANARDLGALLADDTVLGLPPDRIVFTGETATAAEVLDAIHRASRQATGLFLVYFAGHGFLDESASELRMAVHECDKDRPYLAISYKDVRDIMLRCPADSKVTILDCCFSGRANDLGGDEVGSFAARTQIKGSCVMTACSGTDIAHAYPGEEHTAYTGELIRVLRHGIAGPEHYLTPQALTREVKQRLSSRNLPEPTIRSTGDGADIPLAHNLGRVHHPNAAVTTSGLPYPKWQTERPEAEKAVWDHIDNFALPALMAATNKRLLVSNFAKQAADLLNADAVFVDQRVDSERFQPIAEFRSSDGRLHQPERPDYTYPVEFVESVQRGTTAGRHSSNSALQGARLFSQIRLVQTWRSNEPSEQSDISLRHAIASWSDLLAGRNLSFALFAPIFVSVSLWGHLLAGRSQDAGPFGHADRIGAAALAHCFSLALIDLDEPPTDRARLHEQIAADAERLRAAFRDHRGPRWPGGS